MFFFNNQQSTFVIHVRMSCSSTQKDSLPSACLCGLARHFKTESTETVSLCFGYLRAEGKLSSSVDEQHNRVY
jgi:hypothetical protein